MPETEPTPLPQVHANTRAFRGASFHYADLGGATFRDCDMRGVRIVSSFVDGLVVSGFSGRSGPVVVDDVDVSTYVAAELDRRHPERVGLREARSADDLRAVWSDLERRWDETLARAAGCPRRRCRSGSTASGRSSRRSATSLRRRHLGGRVAAR